MDLANSLVDNLVDPFTVAAPSGAEIRKLSSGRSMVLRLNGAQEEIELRNPNGDVEVHIVMTDDGPAVTLRSARLSIETLDSVKVRCREFDVQATDVARVETQHLDLKATETTDLWCDGRVTVAAQEAKIRTADDLCLNAAKLRMQSP